MVVGDRSGCGSRRHERVWWSETGENVVVRDRRGCGREEQGECSSQNTEDGVVGRIIERVW